MNWTEKIARAIAPNLKDEAEIRAIATEEIKRAQGAFPITASYDPKGEGYRPYSTDSIRNRDLMAISQGRMFEIAYFMFDNSAMFKRLAKMDKSFIFGEPIKYSSDDADVKSILYKFWNDPVNGIALNYPDRCMWLGILGEQLWPVFVTPQNGNVRLGYEDPAIIKEIYVNPLNVSQRMQVELQGQMGRPGRKMAIIRKDYNVYSKTYNRLVGDCFFFTLNDPPNASRGRSDYLTLIDWIDALERYGFNYLERAEFLLNFVWDVTLKGMTADQIREWLRDNQAPMPGSMRAHNENVKWDAVAPDINAQDYTKGFDMGKAFIMGAAGRPASWFGEGGKAYQTEAEQFGQVPIADLQERQLFHKTNLEFICQFVIDQAVIAGRLSAEKAAKGFNITMGEVSKRDLTKLINSVPQLATALSLAVQEKLITRDEATHVFAFVCSYLGYNIDPKKQIEAAGKGRNANMEDYLKDDGKMLAALAVLLKKAEGNNAGEGKEFHGQMKIGRPLW